MEYKNKRGMDVHRHWIPQEYVDYIKKGNMEELATYTSTDNGDILQFPVPGNPKKAWVPITEALVNIEKHAQDMVSTNVDVSVISPLPFATHYHGDGKKVLDVCKILNNNISTAVQERGESFRGLGHVPLQDPKLALKELERIMGDLHLSGVHLGTNVRGKYLGDEAYTEFFEAVEALSAVVLVHPIDVAGYDRLQAFYGRNLIGNPLETTITAGSMIFSGMFDRLPRLKIILCHAGGMMPYIAGRWDHGYHMRNECKTPQRLPSSYLKNFYYDIIAHSQETLRFLVNRVGNEQVVVGSDYPLDMGLVDPVGTLVAADLPENQFDNILNNNARKLFDMN